MTQAFRITTRRACFRVDVTNGWVTFAAPIARWCAGLPWLVVRQKLEVRGGALIEELWTDAELQAAHARARDHGWGA